MVLGRHPEAEARLIDRLRRICPDLHIVRDRRPLGGTGVPGSAWRLDFEGTLRGERVRTVAVVVDRGDGRVLFLAACPTVSWGEASASVCACRTTAAWRA